MNKNRTTRATIFLSLLFLDLAVNIWIMSRPYFVERLSELTAIRNALEAYRAANGSYPLSNGVSVGDESAPDPKRWIEGLAPTFIAKVPRDPRRLDAPNHQYLYISDGEDFKIIAHGAEDIGFAQKKHAELVDPRRPNYAYGFWTSRAALW